MHNSSCYFNYNGILKLSGPGAQKFLQGQLTCDVNHLIHSTSTLAAHCNPKGRVLSLFYLVNTNDDYLLIMPESMLQIAEKNLKKYIAFFQCQLTDVSNQFRSCLTTFAENTEEAAISVRIGNHALHLLSADKSMHKENHEPWHHDHITQQLPIVYPETSGLFLPHELHLTERGAVSFDKGCFTGQEIIARLHYRTQIQKTLITIRFEDCEAKPGLDIFYIENDSLKPGGLLIDACHDKKGGIGLVVMDNKDADKVLYLNESVLLHKVSP